MNDWEINKFLKIIVITQLALLTSIGLDCFNIHIPILRQILSVIYLLFLPGMLIMRILKLHKLGSVESLVYAVGLSILTVFFVGLLINMIYPFFGLLKPISLPYLTITMTILMLILSFLSYKQDKNFSDPTYINTANFPSLILLFLCSLPFLAIFGAYLMTFYKLNIILIFLIVIIGLTVIFAMFNKIPKELYPFSIFILAISLLYHISLISTNVYGNDIQQEYFLADLVIKSGYWNFNISSLCNSMLSVTLLPSILSVFSNMELKWIFKIIYPFIFSLVPLGLYNLFKKQTNSKIAFLSCFFFVSLFTFFIEMPTLARQEVGELFLVLALLTIFTLNEGKRKKVILSTFFLMGLITSHYSLTYFYVACVLIVLILAFLSRRKVFCILGKIPLFPKGILNNFSSSMSSKNDLITFKFLLPFIMLALVYYYLTSSSITFNLSSMVINQVLSGIFGIDPNSLQGLNMIVEGGQSSLHIVTKYIQLIAQFFILVGIFKIFSEPKKFNFNENYVNLAFASFIILLSAIFVPYVGGILNTTRIYQIGLIFLAPFGVIGGITVFKFIKNIFHFKSNSTNSALKILSIFFFIFLIFNTGLSDELGGFGCNSIALNKTCDVNQYNDMEVCGASWISNFALYNKGLAFNKADPVLTDLYKRSLLTSFGLNPVEFESADETTFINLLNNKTNILQNSSYMYFGTSNIITNSIAILDNNATVAMKEEKNLGSIFKDKNKIYDDKGSQVYFN